jgi:hypothetical protein
LEGAVEELLRKRRAIVWIVALGSDPDDLAIEAAAAERLDRAQARERSPDHGNGSKPRHLAD